jgi:ATP-dependent helicase HepA
MIGYKVQLKGRESYGFAEIARFSNDRQTAHARFYTGPTTWNDVESSAADLLRHKLLPCQSRCFRQQDGGYVFGRVLTAATDNDGYRDYWIQFPNASGPERLREDEFHVLSYSDSIDAVATLACGGQETPFFADRRSSLLSALMQQSSLCAGLSGLAAARIDLMPHQVEIARRVLQDPVMRYLLADEVGLGKTIEAGIVLKQLSIDHPQLRAAVFAPEVLVAQWREELESRFSLTTVAVVAFEELLRWEQVTDGPLDVAVIDEAHRLVSTCQKNPTQQDLSASLGQLACQVPHLLLLSATPILHREQELLSLLQLLDPHAYPPGDTEGLHRLLCMRQEIGRSLLALENVTMISTARNQIRRVAQLLTHDTMVANLAEEAEGAVQRNDRLAIIDIARRMHLHLSETYRVHRRMLRTRRALLGDVSLGAARREEAAEFELDDARLRCLWEQLEEWRIPAADRSAGMAPEERERWVHDYFSLAEGISCDLMSLAQWIRDRLPVAEPFERAPLERMLAAITDEDRDSDRPSLLVEILQLHNRRYGPASKYVIFCSDPALCQLLASRINGEFGEDVAEAVNARLLVAECQERVQRFRTDPMCHFLVADSVMEEGRNLQFAYGIILYDLPWAPMRLEQRIGRIDRINRTDDVPVKTMLTIDDDIALDKVWYDLLVEGFGIFRSSLSDLQFLIDAEIPRLQQIAFEAGPLELAGQAVTLEGKVVKERQLLAEQDVIDGLRMDAAETGRLWRNLQTAESMGSQLANALCAYLTDSLGMWVQHGRDDREFSYSLHNRRDPLIPADRLSVLADHMATMFTCWRQRAIRETNVQLLRPGHPILQTIGWLLNWDPRGRAYALWRHGPVSDPELVFRITATVRADLGAISAALDSQAYNRLSRESLLRLSRSWFPDKLYEVFIDSNGQAAEPRWAQACSKIYDKDFDINLGGQRAPVLEQEFGGWNWPSLCQNAACAAQTMIAESIVLKNHVSNATDAATQYFALVLDRLHARKLSGVLDADKEERDQSCLRDLVVRTVASPSVHIDSIGAYVFSEQPICPR